MSMVEKAAPKDIDRGDVLNELVHRWYETAGANTEKEPGAAWVLDQLADMGVLAFGGPVDDPSKDLLGTVRREEDANGVTIWEVMLGRHESRHWRSTHSTHRHGTGLIHKDVDMVGVPRFGTVPGSPAWEAEQREIEHTDEFEPEPRVFRSDGPEPPEDVKVLRWLDRESPTQHGYLCRGRVGWYWVPNPDSFTEPGWDGNRWCSLEPGRYEEVRA